MKNPRWAAFISYGNIQQRYNEAIDSLYHLCDNIKPGTNTRRSVSTAYTVLTAQCERPNADMYGHWSALSYQLIQTD